MSAKPSVPRSCSSVVIATCQPPPISPTAFSTGTSTSLKKISLNSASPVICRSGRTSTPGACMSTRRYVSPACRSLSGSLRVTRMHQSAMWANDDHTFWPLTTKRSPPAASCALVRTAERSEPAPGSEKPWHQISSVERIFSRWRSFWASVPCAMIVGPAMPSPITPRCGGASARAISSRKIAWWLYGAPAPPYSFGHVSPA